MLTVIELLNQYKATLVKEVNCAKGVLGNLDPLSKSYSRAKYRQDRRLYLIKSIDNVLAGMQHNEEMGIDKSNVG